MQNVWKLIANSAKVCQKQRFKLTKMTEIRFSNKTPKLKKVIKFNDSVRPQNIKFKLLSISFILLSNSRNNDHISDDEMSKNIAEFESQLIPIQGNQNSFGLTKSDLIQDMDKFGKDWEKMMDTDEIRLWRRRFPGKEETFEYRVCGTYTDISAKSFMNTQVDLAYRKKWDNMVIMLNVIYIDEENKTETIRWVSYYPYPLANREYIYLRRVLIDEENGRAVVVSRAISSHPMVDKILSEGSSSPSIVRVTDYVSRLFVQSHSTFDKPGMDYFLIYYDDPKANIPRTAMKWASASGVPSFIKKLHDAALKNQKSH